jgi:ribosomal protein L6P/L9E
MTFVATYFEIKHSTKFIGERKKKLLPAPEGIQIQDNTGQRDEIWIDGSKVLDVTQICTSPARLGQRRQEVAGRPPHP